MCALRFARRSAHTCMRRAHTVATSLAEAYACRATATSLSLVNSPDLRCVNLMCGHVGAGCACRLSLTLERMPCLCELDVSGNALPTLPDLARAAPCLKVLRVRGNALTALGALPPSLQELDVRDNRLTATALYRALAPLPILRRLWLSGNALSRDECLAILSSPTLEPICADEGV